MARAIAHRKKDKEENFDFPHFLVLMACSIPLIRQNGP